MKLSISKTFGREFTDAHMNSFVTYGWWLSIDEFFEILKIEKDDVVLDEIDLKLNTNGSSVLTKEWRIDPLIISESNDHQKHTWVHLSRVSRYSKRFLIDINSMNRDNACNVIVASERQFHKYLLKQFIAFCDIHNVVVQKIDQKWEIIPDIIEYESLLQKFLLKNHWRCYELDDQSVY